MMAMGDAKCYGCRTSPRHPSFVRVPPKALASEKLIYSEGTHYQTAHNTGAIYSALAVILQIMVVC